MTVEQHPQSQPSQHGVLAVTDTQEWWTDAQIAALNQIGIGDAAPEDQLVFLHHVQRTGLDPFARQIYMVSRNGKDANDNWTKKWTIQTGIDGLRLIGRRAADRNHETLEMSDTEWCGPDGIWHDVWLSPEPPAAARVAIIRNGGRFSAVALFREYAQTTRRGDLTQMWRDKGALMIAKCAEALAWRKAFPQDLSGIYTADEMAANEHPAEPAQSAPQAAPGPSAPHPAEEAPTAEQRPPSGNEQHARTDAGSKLRRKLWEVASAAGHGAREVYPAFLDQMAGRHLTSSWDLTDEEVTGMIADISGAYPADRVAAPEPDAAPAPGPVDATLPDGDGTWTPTVTGPDPWAAADDQKVYEGEVVQ